MACSINRIRSRFRLPATEPAWVACGRWTRSVVGLFVNCRADPGLLRRYAVKGLPLLALNFLLITAPLQADLRGRVIWVFDGDTVALDNGRQRQRVRLRGIDAPEHNQPSGQRARQALRARIGGKVVTAVGHQRDNYGRLLAVVWCNGRDINARQVATGMAWAYRFHHRAAIPAYALLEKQAREKRRGLWAAKSPMEPWRWRRLLRRHGEGGNLRATVYP